MHPQSTTSNVWLPATTTLADARKTAKQGYWASLLVAGATTAIILIGIWAGQPITGMDINLWAFIDVSIYVAIAIGIYRMSRIAAIAGLSLYVINQIYMLTVTGPRASGLGIMLLIVFAFINGIRGTFAYHRLKKYGESSDA
ncbi:MAG: hypothetical protein AAGD25_20245 [Cyanobacteria bacterium P01_F01_bin.150]